MSRLLTWSASVMVLALSATRVWADLPVNTLASFNNTNGSDPLSGLTVSGNALYGVAWSGGTRGDGTVFSVPLTGGTPTVLASFTGANGIGPRGNLALVGSTLYGTTQFGGPNFTTNFGVDGGGAGIVFSIPTTGGTPTVLATFASGAGTNGASPFGGVIVSGGTLYGTTQLGGATNQGTVFSVPITGGSPTILTSFNGTNGKMPVGGLTLSADGKTLYGTTTEGGTNNDGVVFSVPITGGTATALASFSGTDGQNPAGDLLLVGSTLYGTTPAGGLSGGTVFSVPTTGGSPTILTLFNGGNGADAQAGLTLSPDGTTLYGTTSRGGISNPSNSGTVFSLPITGGTATDLAAFNNTLGKFPSGDLTLIGNTLYGTTGQAGPGGFGTVFSIVLPVPEPASLSLLAVAFPLLLRRRRV